MQTRSAQTSRRTNARRNVCGVRPGGLGAAVGPDPNASQMLETREARRRHRDSHPHHNYKLRKEEPVGTDETSEAVLWRSCSVMMSQQTLCDKKKQVSFYIQQQARRHIYKNLLYI